MFSNLRGARILVVEDDPFQAISYGDLLADAGAQMVGPFASAQGAISAIDGTDCDVALVDDRLGTESSIGIRDRLRQLGIPYILVTGYPDRPVHGETVIAKPVSDTLLCDLLISKLRH